MVNFDIKERHGLSSNLLLNTSKEQNDYTVVCNILMLLRSRELTESSIIRRITWIPSPQCSPTI